MKNTMLRRPVWAAALVAVAVSGCDAGLTDINRNPNSPDQATAEQLFANATEASITRAFGAGLHMDITSLWVQHFAEHRYTAEDVYEISDGAISTHWSSFYTGPQQDFSEVIQKGGETDRPNVTAMGTVMLNWTYQIMTDLWGDIGYSEALKGRDPATGNTPKLDPQQQVYTSMLAAMKTAQSQFDAGAPGMGAADLIYRGDIGKWKRFANSLRLRMAMRISDADATLARAEFTDALAAGVFTANSDNAALVYSREDPNVNPIFDYVRERDDHTVSATMVDTLKSLADPRLAVYATKAKASGNYVGMANGVMHDPPLDSLSRIGTYFTEPNAPAVVMSYAEVLFLQAEAAQRGWTAGDAAALYRQAITASMQQYGVAQAAIDAYLAQPRVQYSAATGLQQIGLQKWIALYGNGTEAYAEWRRTGYPTLKAGKDALNDKKIPVRLPYPLSEDRRNSANLQEAISRQGGAGLNNPLWWDKS